MVVYDVSSIVFKNRNVSDGKLLPYYNIKACGERGRQQVEGRSAASGGQPIQATTWRWVAIILMFLPGDVRRIEVYHAMWSGGLWNSSPALVAVIWGGNSTGGVRGRRRREEQFGGFFIFTRKKWEWSQFCIYYCFPLVCVSAWRGLEPKILAKNVSNLLPASILVPVPSHLISGNDSLWFPKCGNWFCHSLAFPRFGN